LSVLATDNLSEVGPDLKKLANGQIGKERGPFRARCSLIDAMTAMLSRPEIASKISGIIVNRKINSAVVGWMTGTRPNIESLTINFGMEFLPSTGDSKTLPSLLVRASLNPECVAELANKLHSGEWQ
jgi:hypothetical protein